MAVLGLILLVAAGVLTAAVVTSNTSTMSVDLWYLSVSNITLGVVFVAGMITTVLGVVGLGLLMGGLRRGRRLRAERRSLRKENQQLAQRVESTRPADAPSGQVGEPRRGASPVPGDSRFAAAPPPPPAAPRGDVPHRTDRVGTDTQQ